MKAFAITRAASEGSNIPFLSEIELPIPEATGKQAHQNDRDRHRFTP